MLLHPTEITIEEFTFRGETHYSMSYADIRVSTISDERDGHVWGLFMPMSVMSDDPNVRRAAILKELGAEFYSRYVQERYGLTKSKKITHKQSRAMIKQIRLFNEFDWSQL